ncbi:MAG: hypothetical protein ABI690_08100 [Chloroflexota bacterium]
MAYAICNCGGSFSYSRRAMTKSRKSLTAADSSPILAAVALTRRRFSYFPLHTSAAIPPTLPLTPPHPPTIPS